MIKRIFLFSMFLLFFLPFLASETFAGEPSCLTCHDTTTDNIEPVQVAKVEKKDIQHLLKLMGVKKYVFGRNSIRPYFDTSGLANGYFNYSDYDLIVFPDIPVSDEENLYTFDPPKDTQGIQYF